MAKKYTLLETLDYLLDSSETETCLEDTEADDSEPEDCNPPEENTGLEEEYQESDEEYEDKLLNLKMEKYPGLLLHLHRDQGELHLHG